MSIRTDQLRPASFRGVPFKVVAAGADVGRRVQVHEYPQRDTPYVEDLGRATRSIPVTGFVVGDDYVDQANRLLAELERPGGGTLVHPWLGTMQVTLVEPARVRFDAEELGVARFEMQFVEAGELAFPAVQASTQSASRIVADRLTGAARNDFARAFSVDGYPDFVSASAAGTVSTLVEALKQQLPSLPVLGDAAKFDQLGAVWVTMMGDPGKLADSLARSVSLAAVLLVGSDVAPLVQSIISFARGWRLARPPRPAVVTASRLQVWSNDTAMVGLVRRAMIAQAVGASASLEATVYDDAIAIRKALVDALDDEALQAPDVVYTELVSARTAVWRDLTERARSSARLRTLRPPGSVPALVLAHDLYEDAGRDGEIVKRNRVRHPGFVPPVDLQVLST